MADTARLVLPKLAESQANAEVVHNDALNRLDFLIGLCVKDKDLTAPPGSPAEGDTYIVAVGGTGAWAGHDGQIAAYYSGWVFQPIRVGLIYYIEDENILRIVRAGGVLGSITFV